MVLMASDKTKIVADLLVFNRPKKKQSNVQWNCGANRKILVDVSGLSPLHLASKE